MYVYTKKGEERANLLGFADRKEGEVAVCGYIPVDEQPTIAKAWREKGYIRWEDD